MGAIAAPLREARLLAQQKKPGLGPGFRFVRVPRAYSLRVPNRESSIWNMLMKLR